METNKIKILFAIFLYMHVSFFALYGQRLANISISGSIKDISTQEPIVGATAVVSGTTIGSLTDNQGNFYIESAAGVELPFDVIISYVGYKKVTKRITEEKATIVLGTIFMETDVEQLGEIVVGASRVEENALEAPVSIETLNSQTIATTASPNFYEALSNIKGIQPNTGSLLFTGVNTRGFADPNNLRFVQLLDGASIVTPGFGIIGNTAGVSELDVDGVELIPGASSALYGADAFNGLILIKTKNPFNHRGISALFKSGVTVQEAGTSPYNNIAVRIAEQPIEEKLAIKVDLDAVFATDWQKINPKERVTDIKTQKEKENYLTNNPFNNPTYDQVDRYGEDDSKFRNVKLPKFATGSNNAPSASDTTTLPLLRRSGVRERDLFNPKIEHVKINVGVYYRPIKGNDLEFSYLYKYSISDIVFRITTSYPFYDFEQLQHQFKIQNNWLTARFYYNKNKANNAFAGRFSGKTIEQTLLPNNKWLELYTSAYRGDVSTVVANNHYQARRYADSHIPAPGSPEFNRAKHLALHTYAEAGSKERFSPQSGAQLFENSAYLHTDLNLNLSRFTGEIVDVQVGGSFRRYMLNSQGSFFNDGKFGFGGDIIYNQYGTYLQLSKKLFNEKIKLTASGRFDKRDELQGFFTPRASIVWSVGSRRQHNFRVSYQTGFRNPSPQEGYINYWVAPVAFVLGGLKENIEKFTFERADGTITTARDYFANAVGISDRLRYTYEDALKGLKPERNTVIEVGYKGMPLKSLYIDGSYSFTSFANFIRNTQLISDGHVAIWYNNLNQKVATHTFNAEVEYTFNRGFKIGANYSLNKLDASEYEKAAEGHKAIDLRYNTPEHRLNVRVGNEDLYKGFGFTMAYRVNSAYDYQSSFGQNRMESFSIVDASISKRIDKINALVKIGGTNIFNEKYTFVYGGPNIGSIYYISVRLNNLAALSK